MTLARVSALFASAFAGSVIGSMAGGGTLITFSTLVFLGVPAIVANATAAVAIVPTGAATMLGHWEDVRENRSWFARLLVPGILGGAVGAALLIATPERSFERLAPFLVFFATALFALQGFVPAAGARGAGSRYRRLGVPAAIAMLFVVAVYEGYFGAGSGILILAILGFLGLSDIHARNGLKGFFVIAIDGVASAYFVFRGAVDWKSAGVMIVGAFAGGYGGARFARGIGRERARFAVVVIGVLLGLLLLVRARS